MYQILHSIYVRENSIEYNQPILQPAKANTTLAACFCCGNSPTDLTVRDQISVIYFDDILMDNVRNDTRLCNPLLSFCCGGKGEEVRLESTVIGGWCYRGRGFSGTCCCVPCVPVGCPDCLCPCAAKVSCALSITFYTCITTFCAAAKRNTSQNATTLLVASFFALQHQSVPYLLRMQILQ